ncbi:sugar porter family MFS transporter [Komagataeibacter melaceti]|uniref:Sugar porter family MFS transporter n=1 Tax=Komagataeibacter melaceti TaxID=2766577 RepID=A0A371YX23_9PROT|nr:sugar porter family MFS transporter [Komagataeibacter melaceti]RFD18798.1 sugar porter family MFS transporter [Komagataeibacter melaceti]
MENQPQGTGFDPARLRTLVIGCLAALAGLMAGLDIGVISGALDLVARAFHASTIAQEWIVSAMMGGAAIGSLCGGWMSHQIGRKHALLVGALVFVAGSLACALAWSIPSMIIGRLVMGLAIGVAAFTAPLYLSEIASEQARGAMISTYQLMITAGIFIAFLTNTMFSYSGNWRGMFAVAAVPGVLFLIGVLFLPYSPRWLMMRGRRNEALQVLEDLRDDRSVAMREIQNISRQLQMKQRGWSLLRHNANFRRSIFLGIALQAMQQLAGVNVVMYYAPRIFALAGYVGPAQLWCTAMVGLVNMLATFIAVGLVDRWGRKPILYTGFIIMAIGMGFLGLVLNHSDLGQTEQIISVFMLLVYISGFAMSAGPLMWVLCSEVQPIQGRDLGISISTLTNWVANMIVGASFLSLLQWLGNGMTFWLFAGFNLVFVLVTWRFVPETRGMSLEKIEQRLMAGLPLREIGQGRPLSAGEG